MMECLKRNTCVWRPLIAAISGAAAAVLLFVPMSQFLVLIAEIVFTSLLVGLAIEDLRTKRVSPAVTLPWIMVGVLRAVAFHDLSFIPFWAGIFLLWGYNVWGGGDAKLLMGLFGLWPDPRLMAIASLASLVAGVPFLIAKYRQVSLRSVTSGLVMRIVTFSLLPTEQELDQGIPFAFVYCLAGAIYLWTVR